MLKIIKLGSIRLKVPLDYAHFLSRIGGQPLLGLLLPITGILAVGCIGFGLSGFGFSSFGLFSGWNDF